MCYDISYTTDIEYLEEYFPEVVIEDWIDIDFSITVHRMAHSFLPHPVLIYEDGCIRLKYFEWGLIASYMNSADKIKKQRPFMCNARAEKVFENSYWNKIRKQRCLIPVTGIYEHREISKKKIPYYITMKERRMFFLPGFYNYSPLADENGEIKGTFTILTTSANELMKTIHNSGENAGRMPLFLTPELERKWLDCRLSDEELKSILKYKFESDHLNNWPVFTIRGNKMRPDGKLKNEPYEWDELNERPSQTELW